MSLGRIDDAADLTMADSGPGIPAEDRERVLERFVRLDTSRGAPGSGLGLSLVVAVTTRSLMQRIARAAGLAGDKDLDRSEEGRVGNECVSTCSSRCRQYHKKKNKTRQ